MPTRQARPLILMIDQIDALIGDTLIRVLRQIRAGCDGTGQVFTPEARELDWAYTQGQPGPGGRRGWGCALVGVLVRGWNSH